MAIRSIFLGAVMVGLVIGSLVAGVRCWQSRGGDDPLPAVDDSPGSPGATAAAFASAWTSDNLDSLYLSLSPDAQRTYPPEVVEEMYERFAEELTQQTLTASVQSAAPGTATLAVRLATAYFGIIEYTTTLNLSQTAAGWAIDWSPAAIHPKMVDGREFKSVIERPVRGKILDRNGESLAVTLDLRYVGLNRSLIQDEAALRASLFEFGFTEGQVNDALASSAGRTQRVRVGPVPEAKSELASTMLRPIPGIVLYFESQRIHPLGPAAAHVVGYTQEMTAEDLAQREGHGYRPGDRAGATGLEASQEEVLAGAIGAELRLVDGAGAVAEVVSSQEFRQGADIVTTLDAASLRAAHEELGARSGAAVVIDPATNAVLALNSSPSFDPDAFERNDGTAVAQIAASAGGPLLNRAIGGVYSAGSTFKLVTAAAGLLHGGYKTTDRLECGAIWTGVDPPRRNWEGSQGLLTIAQGLMRSCNPVFYEIALKLYNDTDGALSETARMFGFGKPSGIVGLFDEAGQVPDAQQKRASTGQAWFPGDEVNLGIGQGDLLITPLQLANAYAAFVNRELRAPRLLESQPQAAGTPIPLDDTQWAHLMNGLRLVTSATGTASAAFAFSGYNDFAGKSGTAEDAGSQQHVLFVAMAPAAAPRAVAAVVLDEGESGSIEAGPIARDIVLAALN